MTASGPVSGDPAARRRFIVATAWVVAIAILGYALSSMFAATPVGQPAPGRLNVFYYLHGAHERPFFLLLGLVAAASGAYVLAWPEAAGESAPAITLPLVRPLWIAVLVFVATWLGARFVLHEYPLSMDEFNAVFQSRIFATGRIVAPVPAEWAELAPAIRPMFVTYRPDDAVWLSSYLPVYPALRAPFVRLGLESAVNPLLGAVTVLLLAAVARRLWPGKPSRITLAVLLLATSSQFLLTSMSWYAMPAHLALNLLWLLLFLRGGRRDLLIVPWIGVVALGLNNPFPHTLFAAPFLASMAFSRQWKLLGYFLTVYLVGAGVWWTWLAYSVSPEDAAIAQSMFVLPGPRQLVNQLTSLTIAASWQAAVATIGFIFALARWGQLRTVERQLAASVILTFAFYAFFAPSQGHGWGYRYLYGSLGNVVLVGAAGLGMAAAHVSARRLTHAVVASLLVAGVVMLPLRAIQAERFTAPFAQATEAIRLIQQDVALLDPRAYWYGVDFLRNDPFLSRPVVVGVTRMPIPASDLEDRIARRGLSFQWVRPVSAAGGGVAAD